MSFDIKNVEVKFVENWKDGWKWASSWALAIVVFMVTTPIPDELLNILPEELKMKIVGIVAMLGLIMRFVGQSALNPTKKNE